MTGLRIAAVGALLLGTAAVHADTVELENGGRLTGRILEDDGAGIKIETVGGVVELPRARIKAVRYEPSAQEQYEQILPLYRDSAEDQFRLGLWCRRHKLHRQRQAHLERAVQLDPDHAGARKALGFHDYNGRWVTFDEKMKLSGRVRYRGRWMLPAEKRLLQREEAVKAERTRWFTEVNRIVRGLLTSSRRSRRDEGRKQLLAIKHPMAVEPMVAALSKEKRTLRILLVDALAGIRSPDAVAHLVRLSLVDDSWEVREAATGVLRQGRFPGVTKMLAPLLRDDLGNLMRRAATLAGQLGDPSVAPQLIELLETKEIVTRKVRPRTDRTRMTADNIGDWLPAVRNGTIVIDRSSPPVERFGSGFTIGPKPKPRRKVTLIRRENQEVRRALVLLTEQDFGYSKSRWRSWWRRIGQPKLLPGGGGQNP